MASEPTSRGVSVALGGVLQALGVGLVAALLLALGGLVVFGAIFESGNSAAGSIVGGVIGAAFFLLGLVMLPALPRIAGKRHLVLDPTGIRWDDPKGHPWSATWTELASVRVTTAYHRVRFGKRYRVRVIVRPVDIDAFAASRPQMTALRARGGAAFDEYSLTLGPARKKVPQIIEGLGRYAGPANGGLIDEGLVMGFGYI